MKTKSFLLFLAVFMAAGFAFINIALAQDEAATDLNITAEDLGVKDQTVLPDSPFYSLKEAWRGVKKAFTFSAEGKAEKELQYASEKLLEAEKLADKDIDAGRKTEILNESMADYEKQMAAFKDRSGKLHESLKKRAVQFHLKQSVILDKLENQVPEQAFVKIKEARDRAAAHFAEAAGKFASPAELPEFLSESLASGGGSDLKDLRGLEFLKELEDGAPEGAREAMRQAREHLLENFEDKIGAIPGEQRVRKMEEYIKNMPGDEAKRMAVLDEIKLNGQIPGDVLEKMELMKAKMAERFAEKVKKFQSSDAKDLLFDHLKSGDLEDVRILDDLEAGSIDENTKEEIAGHHQDSLKKFREKFTDPKAQDAAGRAEQLFEQVRANPDPKTFRLLDDLRKELTPEQAEFVSRLEERGREAVQDRFASEKDKYFQRIQTSNPGDFKFYGDFQAGFDDAEFKAQFEKAREFSAEAIEQRIREFDKPEYAEQFQKRFKQENIPNFEKSFEQHKMDLRNFENRQDFPPRQEDAPGSANFQNRGEPGFQGKPDSLPSNQMRFSPQAQDSFPERQFQPMPFNPPGGSGSFAPQPQFNPQPPASNFAPAPGSSFGEPTGGFAAPPSSKVEGALQEFDVLSLLTVIF